MVVEAFVDEGEIFLPAPGLRNGTCPKLNVDWVPDVTGCCPNLKIPFGAEEPGAFVVTIETGLAKGLSGDVDADWRLHTSGKVVRLELGELTVPAVCAPGEGPSIG